MAIRRFGLAWMVSLVLAALAFLVLWSKPALADPAGAPTNVQVMRTDDSHLQISWVAPPATTPPITGYVIRDNGNIVDTFQTQNGNLATTYTVDDTPFAGGSTVTVSALSGAGLEGTLSAPAAVPASAPGVAGSALASPAPTSSNSTYSTQAFGGGFLQPPYSDQNAPTPYEVYGHSLGVTQIVDTYGSFDLNELFGRLAGAIWVVACFIQMGGTTLFAWAFNKQLYGGVASIMLSLIGTFEASDLMKALTVAAGLGLGIWVIVHYMQGNRSVFYKGISIALLTIAASFAYLDKTTEIVPSLVQSPLIASQFMMSQVEGWKVPGQTEQTYNLSIQPTYNGDSLEQAIRRYQNEDWLETVYPNFCQMSFGDVLWATTTYVPDSAELPTYNHLTFCEYLLKAQTENNTTALDKLRSKTYTSILMNHRTGYVESASPDAYNFYQGKDWESRILYASLFAISDSVHELLKGIASVLVAYAVIAMCYASFVLLCFLISARVPWMHNALRYKLIETMQHIWLPSGFALIFLIGDKTMSSLYVLTDKIGWAGVLGARALLSLITVYYGVKFIRQYKADRRAVRQIVESNRTTIHQQAAPPSPASYSQSPGASMGTGSSEDDGSAWQGSAATGMGDEWVSTSTVVEPRRSVVAAPEHPVLEMSRRKVVAVTAAAVAPELTEAPAQLAITSGFGDN